MALKTDYKDDQLDLDVNLNRRFRLNAVSGETDVYEFEDVTEYDVEGDRFGANDINSTNVAVNNLATEYTYTVETTDWVANTDVATDTDYYTYKADVTASGVNSTSPFSWHMNGAGIIPTEEETESINMILEAISSTNKVTLYATDQPTVELTLAMVGGR